MSCCRCSVTTSPGSSGRWAASGHRAHPRPALHEFLLHTAKERADVAQLGITVEADKAKVDDLHEANPVLGHREAENRGQCNRSPGDETR